MPKQCIVTGNRSVDNEKQHAEALERLYRRAFSEYGVKCLWSWVPVNHPTTAHARVIARALIAEGDRAARELAWKIEDACDATLRMKDELGKSQLSASVV